MADLNLDLSDARTFLVIDEEKSIRGAARRLDVSPNTLRYRLRRIEQRTGTTLFRRSGSGVEGTTDALKLRKIARKMLAAAQHGIDGSPDLLVEPGQITIVCGEGLAALWLAPRIAALEAKLPALTIGLICEYDLSRSYSERADVGISFVRPSNPDLIVSRLGTLHYGCFGSEAYFDQHGMPAAPGELRRHAFIEQHAPGLNASLRNFIIGQSDDESFVRLRTTSGLAMYYAVAAGMGLAFMPTYVAHLSDQLKMVDFGVRLKFDMNYFYHADAKGSPAVRTTVDWLKSAFDPQTYPFFADEFVDPSDFPRGDSIPNALSTYPRFAG